MKIESIVIMINNLMGKQQYGSARVIIQNEWRRLTEPRNYHMLGAEAKELVKVIANEKKVTGFDDLSDKDKRILTLLNEAVREVRLPYAKKIFFEHKELINHSQAQKWLTSDARFMCHAWEKHA